MGKGGREMSPKAVRWDPSHCTGCWWAQFQRESLMDGSKSCLTISVTNMEVKE